MHLFDVTARMGRKTWIDVMAGALYTSYHYNKYYAVLSRTSRKRLNVLNHTTRATNSNVQHGSSGYAQQW